MSISVCKNKLFREFSDKKTEAFYINHINGEKHILLYSTKENKRKMIEYESISYKTKKGCHLDNQSSY